MSTSLLAGGMPHVAVGWMQTAASIKPTASMCLEISCLNIFHFFAREVSRRVEFAHVPQHKETTRPNFANFSL